MRKTLIGLGAAAIMLLTAACGDDDGGDDLGAFEDQYLSQCAAGGLTEEQCACSWDALVDNVSADELRDYAEAVEDNPAAEPPEGFLEAITSCAG